MKKKMYEVTIEAIVTKTYRIKASDSETATDEAHEKFSVLNDGTPEDYEQNTVFVQEVD